jgi:hypothetical protein
MKKHTLWSHISQPVWGLIVAVPMAIYVAHDWSIVPAILIFLATGALLLATGLGIRDHIKEKNAGK